MLAFFQRRFSAIFGAALVLLLLLGGCTLPEPQPTGGISSAAPTARVLARLPTVAPTARAAATATPRATKTPRPAATARPTRTPRPAATSLPAATARPTRTPRPAATATPAAQLIDGFTAVSPDELPPEARETLALIASDGPFPYRQDGVVFQNRERILPRKASGYYHEYTVETPGSDDRGARRIIKGDGGEIFYTEDHYDSFVQVLP